MSFVGRCVVELSCQPRPPACGPRVPWVSCLDPLVCHRVQDNPVTKSQPLCVLVGVVTSCVLYARVRGRVSRSCATENTHTRPPRLERCSSSQSSPVSGICVVRSNISAGCWCSVQFVILFDTFFLVVGSVAIHLVYINANLFVSLKIDQLRMLSLDTRCTSCQRCCEHFQL